MESVLQFEGYTKAVKRKVVMGDTRYPGLVGVTYQCVRNSHPLVAMPYLTSHDMYPLERVRFENIRVYKPHEHDGYLKMFYNNYMDLPDNYKLHMPEDKIEQIGSNPDYRVTSLCLTPPIFYKDSKDRLMWINKVRRVLSMEPLESLSEDDEKRSNEEIRKRIVSTYHWNRPGHGIERTYGKNYGASNERGTPVKTDSKMEQSRDVMLKAYNNGDVGIVKDLLPVLYDAGTEESLSEMMRISMESAESGNSFAMLFLSKAYREGKGTEKDLVKASDWLRKANLKEDGRWSNELFDILWRIGTPESYDEMIQVISKGVDSEDPNSLGRMGRAYREGKGVQKDLGKAAEFMRRASIGKYYWSNELFDILWRIGTPESYDEMIQAISKGVEEESPNSMRRMGKAYRYGRGVPIDLDKSADWLRKASNRNMNSAKIELSEVLWDINTDDSLSEMHQVLSAMAAEGNPDAIRMLGDSYRFGKGVEKNLDKAEELMKKAKRMGAKGANEELKAIMSEKKMES